MNKKSIQRLVGVFDEPKVTPVYTAPSSLPVEESDGLLSYIYGTDPLSGLPSSDFAFAFGKTTSPDVMNYVKSILQNPIEASATIEDDDAAFDLVFKRSDTYESYRARVQEYLNNEKKLVELQAKIDKERSNKSE